MFKLLLILYTIFNIAALVIMLICIISTLVSNINLHKLSTAKIGLPTFTDCKTSFIRCCLTSSLLMLMNWIFFSSAFASESGVSGKEILAKFALIFATVWAVTILVVLITEIVLKFLKNSKVQIKDAFVPLIIRTMWCFILTFIIV